MLNQESKDFLEERKVLGGKPLQDLNPSGIQQLVKSVESIILKDTLLSSNALVGLLGLL